MEHGNAFYLEGIALHYSTDVEIGRARNPEPHKRDGYSTDVDGFLGTDRSNPRPMVSRGLTALFSSTAVSNINHDATNTPKFYACPNAI